MTTQLFLTILVVCAALGMFFPVLVRRARARLAKAHPPLGQMIDIGGYRLHMHVEGTGSPTVVLDAGAGATGLAWELIRPAIAKITTVVVYDRAGLGWSDPGPLPRDAATMAVELHTLLSNARLRPPYILVGHSLGGVVARQFAAKFPDEVGGLVMVDSAHEQQMKRFPPAVIRLVGSMSRMFAWMVGLSKLGVFALKPGLISTGDNGRLPGELVAKIQAVLASSSSHAGAMMAEVERVNAAQTQPVPTLGEIPLTVISHGKLDANALPPSLGQEVRDGYERTWQELQAEITALSRRGRQIVAENSGHNVIFDQPEIVIQSILEMVQASTAGEMAQTPGQPVPAG